MRLPSLLCTGLLWRQDICAGSWISWEKLKPKRAPYLPVSYVLSPQMTLNWCIHSASSWKPTLAQTSPCLYCEAILKSPQAESIPEPTKDLLKKDFNYIVTWLGKVNCSIQLFLRYSTEITSVPMHQNSYPEPMYLFCTRRDIIFCSFNGTLPSYLRSKCTVDYTIYDFVGHPIFLIVTKIWNWSTRGQTFVHIETDITVLVVTLLNLILKPSAFSDTCKSYTLLCNGSKHL